MSRAKDTEKPPGAARDAVNNVAVADDLPLSIPVTAAELEVLENFLGALLEELLSVEVDATSCESGEAVSTRKSD